MFGQFDSMKMKIRLVMLIIKAKSCYLKYVTVANNVAGSFFLFHFILPLCRSSLYMNPRNDNKKTESKCSKIELDL